MSIVLIVTIVTIAMAMRIVSTQKPDSRVATKAEVKTRVGMKINAPKKR